MRKRGEKAWAGWQECFRVARERMLTMVFGEVCHAFCVGFDVVLCTPMKKARHISHGTNAR